MREGAEGYSPEWPEPLRVIDPGWVYRVVAVPCRWTDNARYRARESSLQWCTVRKSRGKRRRLDNGPLREREAALGRGNVAVERERPRGIVHGRSGHTGLFLVVGVVLRACTRVSVTKKWVARTDDKPCPSGRKPSCRCRGSRDVAGCGSCASHPLLRCNPRRGWCRRWPPCQPRRP